MITEEIPDSIKIVVSTAPPVLTLWGFPVEQWMFVASAIVSVIFIIEKAPMVYRRIRSFIEWCKNVKRTKC